MRVRVGDASVGEGKGARGRAAPEIADRLSHRRARYWDHRSSGPRARSHRTYGAGRGHSARSRDTPTQWRSRRPQRLPSRTSASGRVLVYMQGRATSTQRRVCPRPDDRVTGRLRLRCAEGPGAAHSLADIREKLITEALTLGRSRNKAGNVHEREGRRHQLLRGADLAKHLPPGRAGRLNACSAGSYGCVQYRAVGLRRAALSASRCTLSLGSGTATTPILGSMVQKGKLAACAWDSSIRALKRVDLPTFGSPTIPVFRAIEAAPARAMRGRPACRTGRIKALRPHTPRLCSSMSSTTLCMRSGRRKHHVERSTFVHGDFTAPSAFLFVCYYLLEM
eukprot:scaffold5190_cov113-Isochrysis_galbana.AAC.10